MNQVKDSLEFVAAIGIDWSDKKHDVCLMEAVSANPEYDVIKQSPEALSEWINQLRTRFGGRKIAICLEQTRGALINALINYDFLVLYPINPLMLVRYREAFTPSKAKDDPTDSYLLMELVSKHRDKLKPWIPDDELTRSIGILAEARRKAVNLRTRLAQKLRALLKEYFPQALELTGVNLYSVMACDFLIRWPTLETLQKENKQSLRTFYYGHRLRRGDRIEKFLQLIENASPLTNDRAIIETSVITVKMLARQLRILALSIKEYEQKLEHLYAKHPDHEIFSSLPGAGAANGPRLLAAFGTDRSRFESAEQIQKYSGIAPVTERSGKICWVHWRWACSKYVRQSFHEFAAQSVRFSIWAKAHYKLQIERGKSHHAAIRSLAFKWIRIIYRCWKDGVAYDELQYLKALQKRGSSVIQFLAKTA
jgi:transposase